MKRPISTGIGGRGRRGARRPFRRREGGRRPAQRAQYGRDTGEDAAAQGRVPRIPAREGAGEGDPGLRCPEAGGEGGLPPSVCLTWNQAPPFRVIPNFPTKSWALFRRPTSFLPVAGTGQQQGSALCRSGSTEEGGRAEADSGGEHSAHEGPPWSAVEIPQIPAAGMPGDDFFTRGQMCLSLLQTSRPRRRRPRVKALHSSALRGWRPLSSHFADPTNRWGAPQTLAQVRAPSAGLAAATAALSLAPARGPRCTVQ